MATSAVLQAVEQTVHNARQWGIEVIQTWDGPHGDAYWIMSPEKTLAYLVKDGRIFLEVAESDPLYHSIIESKFWADMLFAYRDPAEKVSVGERLFAAYNRNQVSFMPQIALIDPWRPHESLIVQNNVVAIIEYLQMGIKPLPIDYSADIFCVPVFKHWLNQQSGIEALFHTKGSGPELAANAVGLWQARPEPTTPPLLTFAMPKSYAAGERFGKPRGKKFVSGDGFRADEYVEDQDEAIITVCEAIQEAIAEVGHIYQRSGLTTMSYPIGVDYSVFNQRFAPIVRQINELAGFELLRIGSPMILVNDIQEGLVKGDILPVKHAGPLDQGAFENKVRNVSFMRWPTELYPSWQMQQAFVQSQLVASLSSWLTTFDYPYGVLRQQLDRALLKVTHDEPCFVDINSHHEMRGLAISVMDVCHRQIAEAQGLLARPNRPGRNEPRQNHLRYRNPDASYTQMFAQLGRNTAYIEIPATDGYRFSTQLDGQPTQTNRNYWYAKKGGTLEAITQDGKKLPVQLVKRRVGQNIRTYAAVEVEHEGVGAVEIKLEQASSTSQSAYRASDYSLNNGRIKVEVDTAHRLIQITDQSKSVAHTLWLADVGNRGDLYTIDQLIHGRWDSRIDESTQVSSRLISSGSVFQELEATFICWLPAELAPDKKGAARKRQYRSRTTVKNTVVVTVRIYLQDREKIDIETAVFNQSKDHVLQLMVSSGDSSGVSRLREHKDVRYVNDYHQPLTTDVREQEYQRYDSGMFNIGSLLILHPIKFHQVVHDYSQGAVVSIYLLTATGYLSHGDLENRKGHTGGPGTRTNDAQCMGWSYMPLRLRVGADQLSDVELWRHSQNFLEGDIQLGAPGIAQTLNHKLVIQGDVGRLSLKRMELEKQGYVICLNNPSLERETRATFNINVWPSNALEQRQSDQPIRAGEPIEFKTGEARFFLFGNLFVDTK